MNETNKVPPTKKRPGLAVGMVKRFSQIFFGFLVEAAILLIAAGQANWTWAWVFLAIYLMSVSVNGAFLLRTSPETIAERARITETKDWDKWVGGLWALMQFILIPLVAGLDQRFGWTQALSIAWHITGAVVFAFGLGVFGWAMISNAFFSTAIRIQTDRGHTVCRSGPYRVVRHPGYAGCILQSLGIPILLASLLALIPAIVAAILMIIRTSLEDRTLRAELPGYQEFALDVRFRLVPGVW